MKGAALDGMDAFAHQLRAAIDEARPLRTVAARFFRDGVVIAFVRLAEVGGVGEGACAFLFHPQEGGGGVKAAREGDADFFADGQALQDGRLAHVRLLECVEKAVF